MTKDEKVHNLLCALEMGMLNSMSFKMNRKSKEPGKAKEAVDNWNETLRDLKCALIDVIEPNDEQAEAMKESVKTETFR